MCPKEVLSVSICILCLLFFLQIKNFFSQLCVCIPNTIGKRNILSSSIYLRRMRDMGRIQTGIYLPKHTIPNQMPVRCLVQESRSLTCHLLFARGTSIRCRCREKGRLWPHTSHQVVNTRISLGRNCHMSLLIRANFSTSSLRAD